MDVKLLDLYSGCGAMSTGLCLGANLAGLNLVTVSLSFPSSNLDMIRGRFACLIIYFFLFQRWAVDINEYACQSLKLNHPETEVEIAINFGFI